MRFGGTNLYSLDLENGEIKLEIPVAETQDFGSTAGSDCRRGGGIAMKAQNGALYYISAHAHDGAINVWRPGQPARRLTGEDCSADFFDIQGDVMVSVGFAGCDLQEVYRVDFLILAPFTKLSHIVLYFMSRGQLGMDFAIKRGGATRGPVFPW